MKKVGILVYDYTLYGGAEKVALNLANELSLYYDISLISCFSEKNGAMVSLKSDINILVLSNKVTSMTLSCFQLAKKLKNYLYQNNIEVLINITAGVNGISYLATRNLNVKVVYAEHSNLQNKSYGVKHQFRQWLGAKKADYIITLTKADKSAFEQKYKISGKCDYIYNWYDGDISSHEYKVLSKKIITVGRLEKVKGYDRLINVAKYILKKYPDWRWDIYGDGTLRNQIIKEIKNEHLENSLFVMGNSNNIMSVYEEYSFFVMTSYFEGLPLVLLEAKSCLLPIVSFNCPTGPSEIIQNTKDGYLVKNNDIEELRDKIELLILNSQTRQAMSDNSTDILHKFNKSIIINRWINIINKLE